MSGRTWHQSLKTGGFDTSPAQIRFGTIIGRSRRHCLECLRPEVGVFTQESAKTSSLQTLFLRPSRLKRPPERGTRRPPADERRGSVRDKNT